MFIVDKMSDNIKVVVKVRPLIKREKDAKLTEQWKTNGNSIQSLSITHQNVFTFDHIFDGKSSNSDVYLTIADPIVKSALRGFNGTIFAYGQTSSGKTHTMMGNATDPGIIIMAIRELFNGIEASSDREFMIRVGYIEIYNEKVYDLLSKRSLVTVRDARNNDIELQNKEVVVKTEDSVLEIINLGNKARSAASTKMNTLSSRSHAILRIIIESGEKNNENGAIQESYLNLVDLAGSERADQAETTGSRLKEGGHINKSLLSLSCVIQKLSEGEAEFINYRDSKLTRILQASLGGNSNTAIVCNVTPAVIEETYSTLSFANRAKTVQNNAVCNEVYSNEALMNKMRAEINHLRAKLKSIEVNSLRATIEEEIAEKESQFLSSKMRTKSDRRQTWHSEQAAVTFDGSLMPPPNSLGSCMLKVTLNRGPLDLPSNTNEFISPEQIRTPKVLKTRANIYSPSPNKEDLKFQYCSLENDFAELKDFTSLEKIQESNEDVNIIKRLEKQLEMTNEQLNIKAQEQWNLVHTKLNEEFVCSRCSELENQTSANGMDSDASTKISELLNEKSLLETQVKQLAVLTDEKLQLIKQLIQDKSALENNLSSLNEELKHAKSAHERAEIMHAEGEITLSQYKTQSDRRIKELISQIDQLKDEISMKPAFDLNISKIPIKTDTQNSYEIAELKSELDLLRMADESKANEISNLESNLQSIKDEKNVLQSEHTEMSNQIMELIDEMELTKVKSTTMETEIEVLRQKILEDGKQMDELRSTNESHVDSLAKQKEMLISLEKENIVLQSRLAEAGEQAKAECSEQEAMLCNLITENSNLKEQNLFLSDKLITLEPFKAKNDMLASSVKELEAKNMNIDEQLNKILSTHNSLDQTVVLNEADLGGKVVALSNLIDHYKQAFDKYKETKINETNSVVTELTENYASARQTILELENEIQKLKVSCDETKHINEDSPENLDQSLSKLQISTEDRDSEERFSIYLASILQEFESQVFCLLSLHQALQCKVDILEKLLKFKNIKRSVDKYTKLGTLKLKDLDHQIDLSDEIDENIQKLKNKSIELELQNAKDDFEVENIAQLQSKLVELTAKYSTSIQDLNAAKKSLSDLSSDKSMLEANVCSLQDSECKLKAVNEQQTKDLKAYKENYSELERKYLLLQCDYDASCLDTEKLRAIVDKNRLVLEQTEEECITMKASFIDCYAKIKSLMEDTETLSSTNSKLESENKSLKNVIETKSSEISNSMRKIEELQHINSILNSKKESEQALFENLEKLQEEHHTEMEEKRKHMQNLSEQFELSQNLVETKSSEIVNLKKQIEELQHVNSLVNSKLESEEASSKNLQEFQEKLHMEMKEKRKHIQDLVEQFDMLQNEHSANKHDVLIISEDKIRLENEIKSIKSEKDDRLSEVTNSLEQIKREKVNLENELRVLNEKHLALNSKLDSDRKDWNVEKCSFEKVIAEFKCDIGHKEQLLQSANNMIADFENQLRQSRSEKKAEEELQTNQLKSLTLQLSEVNEKCSALTSVNNKLVADTKEIFETHDKSEAALKNEIDNLLDEKKNLKKLKDSALNENGNLRHQFDELKLQFKELEESSQHKQDEFVNMKKYVAELENRVDLDLQNSLDRSNDELRKSPASLNHFKKTMQIDRKSRRHSQHDEIRILMNETVNRPTTIGIQTDPLSAECKCIEMDLKIKDLTKALKVKECIISTLNMEMEFNPLKAEVSSLKRKLEEKKNENHLLQLNVNHYKAKAIRAQNGLTNVPCPNCDSKDFLDEETQTDPDDTINNVNGGRRLGPLAYHYLQLPEKYRHAKSKIAELNGIILKLNNEKSSNGESSRKQSENNHYQMPSNNASSSEQNNGDNYEQKEIFNELTVQNGVKSESSSTSVDVKYEEGASSNIETHSNVDELQTLQEENRMLQNELKGLKSKCNVYKQVAVSRRMKVVELENELKQYSKSKDN